MSGLVKFISKAFKQTVKAIKKFGRQINREFNRSGILKAVAAVAIVWFTAGAAMNYFAAPSAGLGSAMSAQASSMWSATTSFFGAEAAATGATTNAAVATPLAPAAEVVGTEMVGTVTGAGAGAGAGAAAGTGAEMAVTMPGGALSASQTAALEGAAATAETAAAAGSGGITGWMAKNPVSTMMIGQGISGAVQADAAAEAAADAEKAAKEERESRGLMGFDYNGNYGKPGQSGIVMSHLDPGIDRAPATQQQQVYNPSVTPSQVVQQNTIAPQAVTGQTQVPREKLPQLMQQNSQTG